MNKDENVSVEENKKENIFSNVWKKTVDIGKKAAEGVQKGAKVLVEQTKKNLKQNCNYDMSIDNLIFKIWEE